VSADWYGHSIITRLRGSTSGSYRAACADYQRHIDTYISITPYLGPPHQQVHITPRDSSYCGYIDLITPVTIGPKSLYGLKYPFARISQEDLYRVDQLYRGLTQYRPDIDGSPRPPTALTSTTASSYHMPSDSRYSFLRDGGTIQSSSSNYNGSINSDAAATAARELLGRHSQSALTKHELEAGLNSILSACGISEGLGTDEHRTTAHGRQMWPLEPALSGKPEDSSHPEPPTGYTTRGGKSTGKRPISQISRSSGGCKTKKLLKHKHDHEYDDDYGSGPSNHKRSPHSYTGNGSSSAQRGDQNSQQRRSQGSTNHINHVSPNPDDMGMSDEDDEDGRPPPGCGGSTVSKAAYSNPMQADSQGSGEEWTSTHWENIESGYVRPSKWESLHARLREYNTSQDSLTRHWLNDTKFHASDYTPEERKKYWLIESRQLWALGVWIRRLVERDRSGRGAVGSAPETPASVLDGANNHLCSA
jgi:hypothetical protein